MSKIWSFTNCYQLVFFCICQYWIFFFSNIYFKIVISRTNFHHFLKSQWVLDSIFNELQDFHLTFTKWLTFVREMEAFGTQVGWSVIASAPVSFCQFYIATIEVLCCYYQVLSVVLIWGGPIEFLSWLIAWGMFWKHHN